MSNELIKDKQSFDPIKLANPILVSDHKTLHTWWIVILKGGSYKGWSRDDVYNAHNLAAQEMTKRKLGIDSKGKHASPLPTSLSKNSEEDNRIKDFENMCLKELSEEFDFALTKGWLEPSFIPDKLAVSELSEIRNQDQFILRKNLGDRAIICLRDDSNKLTSKHLVELVKCS